MIYTLYNIIYRVRAFGVTDSSDQLAKSVTNANSKLIDTLKIMANESARPFSEMLAERDRVLGKKP
jgi:hypothetical protein